MSSVVAIVADAQPSSGIAVRGELWFDAKATMGDFRGITREVRGAITAADSLADVRGWIEFNAAELTTGNGLRDRDMRSSLEVEKHPTIRFDLDSVVVASATDATADSVRVILAGRMTIHGVTKALQVPSLVRRDDELVRATGNFELHVPAYGIGGLSKMFGMLKMEETVRIGFDVTFNTGGAGAGYRPATARLTPNPPPTEELK
jgi:polyisoprenoid-binding protein YceI